MEVTKSRKQAFFGALALWTDLIRICVALGLCRVLTTYG